MAIHQLQAGCCDRIDAGCFDLTAVATEVGPTGIVQHHNQDIGLVLSRGRLMGSDDESNHGNQAECYTLDLIAWRQTRQSKNDHENGRRKRGRCQEHAEDQTTCWAKLSGEVICGLRIPEHELMNPPIAGVHCGPSGLLLQTIFVKRCHDSYRSSPELDSRFFRLNRRHLSLQHFTSDQTFRHFFRQSNSRWQTTQIFVGRFCFWCDTTCCLEEWSCRGDERDCH